MVTSHSHVFTRDFYTRPTVAVARDLVGTLLCRRLPDGTVVNAPIVEVEAYTHDDPACHAFKGLTERTRVMFGPPGHAYVYFIYGMYNCLNVVTEPEGVPGAVLIRALGIDGASGPGKLCVKLNIDRSYNGVDLCSTESPLWVVKGQPPEAETLRESIRIGISSAQDRVWRFYLSGNPYVSGPRHLGGAVKAKPTRKTRNQSL